MGSCDDSSCVTANKESPPCLHHHHHHPASSDDVIMQHHQQVTCSGEGDEAGASAAPSQHNGINTCMLCPESDKNTDGPIRCFDVRGAGQDQEVGLNLRIDVIETTGVKSNVDSGSLSCTKGSDVNCSLDAGGISGGGATGGSALHLDNTSLVPLPKSFHHDTEEQSSSDDEAFTVDQPLSSNQLSPHATTSPAVTCARNTFECSRRQSAPGQLVHEDGGSECELQSRRPDIIEYFSSRKQRSVSHSVAGWKLFGKVPPKQSPTKHARIIQQEFEARQLSSRSSPTHHTSGQQSRRKFEVEPLSTTALILEDRPPNLPAKSAEETQRHREQYEQMVAEAKRRELKEAQRREQQRRERLRQEEEISNNTSIWNNQILPQWDTVKSSRRTRDLWWGGLPPSVRGRVWSIAIGNELNITAELYEIFLCRAKESWRNVGESDDGEFGVDRESSLEQISRDVSRTFPSLCVFQKSGPYHDMLQSILGAYSCYRPDVGYVQGMSLVAAMLVLNMEEVDAFISFSNLINKPCHLAFYRVDHQQMLRYFRCFEVFFEDFLPRLFLHFQSSGVTPDLYLMDWVLSLYLKPLPLDVACRVWDVFFRDGEEFLFRAALGILRLYEEELLHLDLISIAQFLSSLPDEELLSDRLFSSIEATPTQSRGKKWSQVLSSCRETEKQSSS